MCNGARKLAALGEFGVARTGTGSSFRIFGELFFDASTGALLKRDGHENGTVVLKFIDSEVRCGARATRARSLACVRLIHQPLVHLHDRRHVGQRLAVWRDMAAIPFYGFLAGIVRRESELQV